jgi:putative membrane protein
MHRVQQFILAAGLAVAFMVASTAVHAQAPASQSGSTAKAAAGSQPSSQDTTFVQQAAAAGKMEVEHGKIAASQASNAQVKAFGNKLVKDHTAANNQLMAIAKRHNIDTTAAPAGDAPAWKSLTGAAFDRAFIDAQVKSHQDAIALFEKEAQGGTDKEIKQFASRQLPALRTHLKQAQDLQKKLGASTH